MEGGPSVISDLQGALHLHYTCHRTASVVFDFPAEVSWPNIASLPRNVSSSSKQIPSEVNDFPIPNAFTRHLGGVTPPRPPLFTCMHLLVKSIGTTMEFEATNFSRTVK